jgi:hypothetical protein
MIIPIELPEVQDIEWVGALINHCYRQLDAAYRRGRIARRDDYGYPYPMDRLRSRLLPVLQTWLDRRVEYGND